MNEDLKPCPHCGAAATYWQRFEDQAPEIICTRCVIETAADWNRRAPGPATREVIKWINVYFDPPEEGLFVEMVCAKSILKAFLAEWS